jgi:hypothetical protein
MIEPADVRIARLEERIRLQEVALKLQAYEYNRRLDALNVAHEKAVQAQRTYVTSEKFEDFVEYYGKEREAAAKALTGNRQGVAVAGWIVGGVGFLLSVGALILVVGDVLTP